jgi:hypothetical protein
MSLEALYASLEHHIGEYVQNVIGACGVDAFFGREEGESAIKKLEAAINAPQLGLWRQAAIYTLQLANSYFPKRLAHRI